MARRCVKSAVGEDSPVVQDGRHIVLATVDVSAGGTVAADIVLPADLLPGDAMIHADLADPAFLTISPRQP